MKSQAVISRKCGPQRAKLYALAGQEVGILASLGKSRAEKKGRNILKLKRAAMHMVNERRAKNPNLKLDKNYKIKIVK